MTAVAPSPWWRPTPASSPPVGEGLEPPGPSPQPDQGSGALAFRALMTFTSILLLAPQTFLPVLRPFRIALLAALVGITARVVDGLSGSRPLLGGREMALTAGLVAWAVITLPLSYWPGGSASFLLDVYFKAVAIFWLLANTVESQARLTKVAWLLTVISVPLSVTGIKNFLSGAFIADGSNIVRRIVGYEAGLTSNPNDLALMLNLILPLSVALLLAARSVRARVVLSAVVALQAIAVVVTFSRGGFVTLAAILALYVWRLVRRGRRAWAALALAAAVAGLTFLPSDYRARLATITDIDADPTGSAQMRWADNGAALSFVREHPLIGAGVGMNVLALNEVRGPAWTDIHNVYLAFAVDLGLVGLVLFLLLLRACLQKVRDVRRRTLAVPALRELWCLAGGIEIALLAFAVAAFFHPVGYNFYFYYLAGLAVAAGAIHGRATAAAETATRAVMARAS